MTVSLTPRQADLLRFIESYAAARGTSPTFEEMRLAIGSASKASVFRLLGRLEERGHIRRMRGRERAIEVCGTGALDPADAALLADVQAATADPFADPVVLRGVSMPRALARRIEAPLLRLRSATRREAVGAVSRHAAINSPGGVR
jgi:SOS-response transcriptional repressor LexA